MQSKDQPIKKLKNLNKKMQEGLLQIFQATSQIQTSISQGLLGKSAENNVFHAIKKARENIIEKMHASSQLA